LLPGVRVNNEPAVDGQGHYWCEVYLDKWRSWEPFGAFLNGKFWFALITAPYVNRPDGLRFSHIELYRDSTKCTGVVKDSAGNPLDGAKVSQRKNSKVYPAFTISDRDGKYELYVISGGGTSVSKGFSGALPQLHDQPATLPLKQLNAYKMEYSFESPSEAISYGKPTITSEPGSVNFFICDRVNYNEASFGSQFSAFETEKKASSRSGSFILPADGKWYLVLSNRDKARATEAVNVTVKVYKSLEVNPLDRPVLEDPGDESATGSYTLNWSSVAGAAKYELQEWFCQTSIEDGAESGTGLWTLNGFKLSGTAHTGDYSYYSDIKRSDTTYMTLKNPVRAGDGFTVSFWRYYDFYNFSYAYLEISVEGGAWSTLKTYSGEHKTWTLDTFDLSEHSGKLIRFRFRCDRSRYDYDPGFYFDDFCMDNIYAKTTWTMLSDSIGSTSHEVTGRTGNGTYYYRVRAIDEHDDIGFWSNVEDIKVKLP
jgi:hypothetical protein